MRDLKPDLLPICEIDIVEIKALYWPSMGIREIARSRISFVHDDDYRGLRLMVPHYNPLDLYAIY